MPAENGFLTGSVPESEIELEEVVLPPFEEELPPVEATPPVAVEAPAKATVEPVSRLEEAVKEIPEGLRKEMAELLRADFSRVVRWKE